MTIQRDLFYGYDTLMENVSDPSHIDFAHHKVFFSLSLSLSICGDVFSKETILRLCVSYCKQVTGRRDRAKPLPFKVESSGPWGFQGANDDSPKITAKFVAPCYSLNK